MHYKKSPISVYCEVETCIFLFYRWLTDSAETGTSGPRRKKQRKCSLSAQYVFSSSFLSLFLYSVMVE